MSSRQNQFAVALTAKSRFFMLFFGLKNHPCLFDNGVCRHQLSSCDENRGLFSRCSPRSFVILTSARYARHEEQKKDFFAIFYATPPHYYELT